MVVGSGVDTGQITVGPNLDTNGLAGIIVGYMFIFIVGIAVSLKFNSWKASHTDLFLAGRQLGYGIGAFTITATWIGGSIIHVTAGRVWSSDDGVLWVHAPIAFAFSLLLGGLFFAQKVRKEIGCVTILDPIEKKMGKVMVILIALPMLASQIIWASTTFSSLSVTLAVTLGVDNIAAIFISAFVVYVYASVGGLYAVIVTDIFQIIFIFIALWVGFGFANANPLVTSIAQTARDADGWLGVQNVPKDATLGRYFDSTLRYLFAGVTFQIYIQRILCTKDSKVPKFMSVLGALLMLFLVLPGILIGAVARSMPPGAWAAAGYHGKAPDHTEHDFRFVLPLVLRYLPPYGVGIFCLVLMAVASLASVDAAIVSSAVLFTNNVFSSIRSLCFKTVPESREMLIITRIAMGVVTLTALVLAIFVDNIYDLWGFTVTMVYVVVFPQVLAVIFFNFANGIGSFVGYVFGMVMVFLAGDYDLGLPTVIRYPWFEEDEQRQNFPYKTVLMAGSFCLITVVSALTHLCYRTGIVPDCCNLAGPSRSVEKKAKKGVNHMEPI